AGHTFRQIAATHINFTHLAAGKGTADLLLDPLGRRITNHAAVVAANIVDDGLVKPVPTNPHGIGIHHTIQRDNGNFSSTATDIHHHGTTGLGDFQTGTDSSCHGFFDQTHFTGTGAHG